MTKKSRSVSECLRVICDMIEDLGTAAELKSMAAESRRALAAQSKRASVAGKASRTESGRPPTYSFEQRQEFATAPGSIQEVADRFGCHYHTVRHARNEFGIKSPMGPRKKTS